MAKRKWILGALTNWLAFFATIVVSFFLSPYLIKSLGDSQYGCWVFVESILAYFTLFDMGIAACVVRYVSRYHTVKEWTSLNQIVSSSFVVFVGLACLVFLIGLLLMPILILPLSQDLVNNVHLFPFMYLMLVNLALTLPLSTFPAILDGLNRFTHKSLIRLVSLAVRTIAIVMVVERSPNLWDLGIIFTVVNFAEHLVMAIFAWKHLPSLRIRLSLVNGKTIKLIWNYSIDAFLIMIAGRITLQSPALIIGLFMQPAFVTWFAISLRLVEFARAFLRSATTIISPTISSLDAQGDEGTIRKVFIQTSKWSLYFMIPIQLGLILLGKPFLRLWLHSEEYELSSYPSLWVLSIPLFLFAVQSIGVRILYGTARLKPFTRICIAEAILNIVLSFILIKPYGIFGIAWALTIPQTISCLAVIVLIGNELKLSWKNYFLESWFKPLIANLILGMIWLSLMAPINHWHQFALLLGQGLLGYVCVLLLSEVYLVFQILHKFFAILPKINWNNWVIFRN